MFILYLWTWIGFIVILFINNSQYTDKEKNRNLYKDNKVQVVFYPLRGNI